MNKQTALLGLMGICSLVIGCGDDSTPDAENKDVDDPKGACVDLDTSIDDDFCTETTEVACTGTAEWSSKTCSEEGYTQSCDGGKLVQDGAVCPGAAGPEGSCLLYFDSFGDDICVEVFTEEECLDIEDAEWEAAKSCVDLEIAMECDDGENWVEDGVTCPEAEASACVIDDLCYLEIETECLIEGADFNVALNCEDAGYTVDCGTEEWVAEGTECP